MEPTHNHDAGMSFDEVESFLSKSGLELNRTEELFAGRAFKYLFCDESRQNIVVVYQYATRSKDYVYLVEGFWDKQRYFKSRNPVRSEDLYVLQTKLEDFKTKLEKQTQKEAEKNKAAADNTEGQVKDGIEDSIEDVNSSTRVGQLHDDFVIGTKTSDMTLRRLVEEGLTLSQAEKLLEKWSHEQIRQSISSGVTYERDSDGNYEKLSDAAFSETVWMSETDAVNEVAAAVKAGRKVTVDGQVCRDSFSIPVDFEYAIVN